MIGDKKDDDEWKESKEKAKGGRRRKESKKDNGKWKENKKEVKRMINGSKKNDGKSKK